MNSYHINHVHPSIDYIHLNFKQYHREIQPKVNVYHQTKLVQVKRSRFDYDGYGIRKGEIPMFIQDGGTLNESHNKYK